MKPQRRNWYAVVALLASYLIHGAGSGRHHFGLSATVTGFGLDLEDCATGPEISGGPSEIEIALIG